jgi:hypothetical protein
MWEVERMKPARIIVSAGRTVEEVSARRVAASRTAMPAAPLPPAATPDARLELVDLAPCRTTGAAFHAKSGRCGRVDVIRSCAADMSMPT